MNTSLSPKKYYKKYLIVCALSSLMVLPGCGSLTRQGDRSEIREIPGYTPPEEGYEPNPSYGRVPLPMNANVERWINYFTGRGRRHMDVYLARSSRYLPMMKATLRERGMPDELVYVALIESGFSSSAHSHASAVGYWQFIRGTGLRYNLKIDEYVDERRDPILSTQAAANYLDALYNLFGDWHLALAGYNAGENRIQRAIMRRKTRDFWELSSIRRTLPVETMNYVPKFIAATYIAQDPEKYGFKNVNFQPEFEFESIVIDKSVSLELLAEQMGITYEVLQRLNPRYISDFVPIYSDRKNAVRVPVGQRDIALAALPQSYASEPRRYIATYEWYRVRRGDTLSHIARRNRTSIARIRDINNWGRRRTMIREGQRIKVPITGRRSVAAAPQSRPVSSAAQAQVASGQRVVHIVRRGENLTTIARRYGTTVGQIQRLNNLRNRSLIRAGQSLVISEGSAQATNDGASTHTVRRGESLSLIAARHGTTVAELQRLNNIRNRSMIRAGQKLTVPGQRVHVVRRGENLSTIARRYRASVSEIAQANSIENKSVLFVGTRLVIP